MTVVDIILLDLVAEACDLEISHVHSCIAHYNGRSCQLLTTIEQCPRLTFDRQVLAMVDDVATDDEFLVGDVQRRDGE